MIFEKRSSLHTSSMRAWEPTTTRSAPPRWNFHIGPKLVNSLLMIEHMNEFASYATRISMNTDRTVKSGCTAIESGSVHQCRTGCL